MSYIVVEFRCRACGAVSERLLSRSAPAKSLSQPPCGCAARADRILSAPKVGTVWCAPVSTGKSDPIPSWAGSTESIADGKHTVQSWRKERNKLHRDARWKRIKRDLDL